MEGIVNEGQDERGEDLKETRVAGNKLGDDWFYVRAAGNDGGLTPVCMHTNILSLGTCSMSQSRGFTPTANFSNFEELPGVSHLIKPQLPCDFPALFRSSSICFDASRVISAAVLSCVPAFA